MRGRNANYGPLAESVKYAPKLRQTIEQGLSLKRCTKRLSAARRRKKSSGWCASARSCAWPSLNSTAIRDRSCTRYMLPNKPIPDACRNSATRSWCACRPRRSMRSCNRIPRPSPPPAFHAPLSPRAVVRMELRAYAELLILPNQASLRPSTKSIE